MLLMERQEKRHSKQYGSSTGRPCGRNSRYLGIPYRPQTTTGNMYSKISLSGCAAQLFVVSWLTVRVDAAQGQPPA
jgi:hypothetical protein